MVKERQYLSKDYTNCLRGIFAILVVIHHLYQYSSVFTGTILGEILQLSGTIAVAVFFFLSGYGLMFSANKKNYIQNFLRNRFLPLYCFYIVLVVLYSLWALLLEGSISPQRIMQSFFFGGTIVTNGWYLQATFVFYLSYLFVFKVFQSPKMQVFVFSITVCTYVAFCFLSGLGTWWYQTAPCLILGMVYCYKKDKMDALLAKYAWTIFISTGTLFVVLAAFDNLNVLVGVAYSLLFVCAVISLSYILYDTPAINNPFFALCGKYSLEIYVTHGFFLRMIRLNIIENKLLAIFVVVVGTTGMSAIMKIAYKKIVGWISISKQRNPCESNSN